MDCQRLKLLSFEELQAKAIRYTGLLPSATRSGLIDQIMMHLEHHSLLLDMRNEQSSVDNTIPSDSNMTLIKNAQTSLIKTHRQYL